MIILSSLFGKERDGSEVFGQWGVRYGLDVVGDGIRRHDSEVVGVKWVGVCFCSPSELKK